jgi:cobyric acid synthase
MIKTLKEYNDMDILTENERTRMHTKVINMLLDNPELLRDNLQDIVDCFVTDLGNSDFIRLCDTVNDKVKRG